MANRFDCQTVSDDRSSDRETNSEERSSPRQTVSDDRSPDREINSDERSFYERAIYFILKISSCKVCPKTYPPNTRLKLHIGRYQEVLELIGDVFLMELF